MSATTHVRRRRAPSRVLRDQQGMTIMELLMAAFIGLVAVGMVFAAVRVQGRSAAYQSGLADAQLTSRGAGELLLQDLRMAGFGMLGVAATSNVPPLAVTVNAGVTTLTLRGAFNNVTTTLANSAASGQNQLVVNTPSPNFTTTNLVLVDSGLSSEVFTISGVSANGATTTLTLSGNLANSYPIGPYVTQIEVVIYTYDGTFLRRNGQVVADSAPTFQLQYVDQDGTVTAAPGTDLRSVMIDFRASQPTKLADNPTATSRVTTEANMRNLAFRFTLN